MPPFDDDFILIFSLGAKRRLRAPMQTGRPKADDLFDYAHMFFVGGKKSRRD